MQSSSLGLIVQEVHDPELRKSSDYEVYEKHPHIALLVLSVDQCSLKRPVHSGVAQGGRETGFKVLKAQTLKTLYNNQSKCDQTIALEITDYIYFHNGNDGLRLSAR